MMMTTAAYTVILGHMSQTGSKKCFLPKHCEKCTNFGSRWRRLLCVHLTPINYIFLESLYSMDAMYANINVKIQGV